MRRSQQLPSRCPKPTHELLQISDVLERLNELAHKWQEEDAKGGHKRKARAV
jgi:hypothetical protein